jgi:nucleotide-binding universal stress UspA family protein
MFSNVVVGIDGRAGGRDAVALAKRLSAAGARITLAHVYGGNILIRSGAALVLAPGGEKSEQLLMRERTAASLDAELKSYGAASVGRGLHAVAQRQNADVLVIGSCHRGALGRTFLGDDSQGTLNGAPCPVSIAPAGYLETQDQLAHVGVGYDASPESGQALALARRIAAHHGSAIRALSVVSLQSIPYGEPIPVDWPEVAQGLVDGERKRFQEVDDVDGDASYGEPSEELARFSEELDLLIVGSRGYGPMGRLLNGSTSTYLARRTQCPLLVVPPAAATSQLPAARPLRAQARA